MGQFKTATAILDARGAFKTHPDRKRPNEPKVRDPLPKKIPAKVLKGMTDEEAGCWHELASYAPRHVLTAADVPTLELAAKLLAEFREVGRDFTAAKLGKLMNLYAKMGLDPSGRASLVVPQDSEANPFDDI